MRTIGRSLLLFVVAVATYTGAQACEKTPVEILSPPPNECHEMQHQIPSITIESLASSFPGSERFFVREETYPLFFFHYLPGVVFGDGKALSLACHAAFTPTEVMVSQASEHNERILIYKDSACGTEEIGIWAQLSPIVTDPITGHCGIFVRITRIPCAPIGGSRYWAVLESRNEPRVTSVIDLNVIEF